MKVAVIVSVSTACPRLLRGGHGDGCGGGISLGLKDQFVKAVFKSATKPVKIMSPSAVPSPVVKLGCSFSKGQVRRWSEGALVEMLVSGSPTDTVLLAEEKVIEESL